MCESPLHVTIKEEWEMDEEPEAAVSDMEDQNYEQEPEFPPPLEILLEPKVEIEEEEEKEEDEEEEKESFKQRLQSCDVEKTILQEDFSILDGERSDTIDSYENLSEEEEVSTPQDVQPRKPTILERKNAIKEHLSQSSRQCSKERPFQCTICEKRFTKICNLYKHELLHQGVKPHKCEICLKSFAYRDHLVMHMRSHTGEKPYSCSVCQKDFSRSSNLQIHMRIHTEERPYQCHICSKRFKQKAHLSKHLLSHTDEPYMCEICKKVFVRKDRLTVHVNAGVCVRIYECNICEKSFTRNDGLVKHMLLHSKIKPPI